MPKVPKFPEVVPENIKDMVAKVQGVMKQGGEMEGHVGAVRKLYEAHGGAGKHEEAWGKVKDAKERSTLQKAVEGKLEDKGVRTQIRTNYNERDEVKEKKGQFEAEVDEKVTDPTLKKTAKDKLEEAMNKPVDVAVQKVYDQVLGNFLLCNTPDLPKAELPGELEQHRRTITEKVEKHSEKLDALKDAHGKRGDWDKCLKERRDIQDAVDGEMGENGVKKLIQKHFMEQEATQLAIKQGDEMVAKVPGPFKKMAEESWAEKKEMAPQEATDEFYTSILQQQVQD
eukprot:TRINITY_DN1272_c0_g1_i7.p2 TRINITY_DN1272_c0_g1~~TRINITY_DN1272_c0_g1_i7.p2  ORF type:complete len:327 (+),score=152.47 TRINITY_DN1272_c0_g1_i7:132-983(+)